MNTTQRLRLTTHYMFASTIDTILMPMNDFFSDTLAEVKVNQGKY